MSQPLPFLLNPLLEFRESADVEAGEEGAGVELDRAVSIPVVDRLFEFPPVNGKQGWVEPDGRGRSEESVAGTDVGVVTRTVDLAPLPAIGTPVRISSTRRRKA